MGENFDLFGGNEAPGALSTAKIGVDIAKKVTSASNLLFMRVGLLKNLLLCKLNNEAMFSNGMAIH